MITKTSPAASVYLPYAHYYEKTRTEREYDSTSAFRKGAETITYGEGPRVFGHWPWKPCIHTDECSYKQGDRARYHKIAPNNGWVVKCEWGNIPNAVSPPALPNVTFSDDCIRSCLSQINLNSSDAVLLYSGVVQAVPLLGSVLKFNRVLKDVSRYLSKSLRKKPFTTVIKGLIQADFIDRFVIAPTLADARKFQDATDYCLRVIDTARQRNEHSFAVSATDKVVLSESTSTFRGRYSSISNGEILFNCLKQQTAVSKAFMLVRAKYDMTAVSPIKLWAQRVGLTRPLDSVWDLVPFSFVVDYFTRAGDFISHLSDEMSQVDGLKGEILSIEDMWSTLSGQGVAYATQSRWVTQPSLGSGWTWVVSPTLGTAPSVWKRERFLRSRISSPWSVISSLSSRIGDYLSVNLDLSQTRKRTLAELVIQAKL